MTFAGVLDFLNGGGGSALAVFIVVSIIYFLAQLGFQLNRCQAKHPRTGTQCRLAFRHRPRSKHRTWGGEEWYG